MLVVVDTNVAVVANGRSQQASPECVMECLIRIRRIIRDEDSLALDDLWRIIREYKDNLSSTGQPGAGDAFLKWALTNWANPDRCVLVKITPTDDGTSFVEFPDASELANFDPADRKFVAVSMAHSSRPPILQAVDSKWWQLRNELQAAGVKVDFLCEDDIQSFTS